MESHKKISVYTDGACKGNSSQGGWGWVEYIDGINGNLKFLDYGGETKTTNNRMELQAVIEYLKYSKKGRIYTIYSDSLQYVVKGLVNGKEGILKIPGLYSGWMKKWIKEGLETRKNGELWIELDKLIQDHLKLGTVLEIKWVKGHNGNIGNTLADDLANLGALNI